MLRIKALVWEENQGRHERECRNWFAQTAIGDYWIEKKKKFWISSDGAGQWRKFYDTLEEAQAAVQDSHENRIAQCFEYE